MVEPKIKDLVQEFGMTRQAFNSMRKKTPEKYQIYVDAWEYRKLKEDMKT